MEVVNKKQMKALMEEYPDGGIVFAEYTPSILTTGVMVTDGDFGATNVIPYEGGVFDWDWNIDELRESDLLVVFDNNDVLQMIQTLVSGLQINLNGCVTT